MQDPDQGTPPPLPIDVRRTLELLATGLSINEVAELLGCPPDEVRDHLVQAIRALGARSKLEAIVIARQQGLQ
jgi:DNA-binding NarL/FixJ family response regulator